MKRLLWSIATALLLLQPALALDSTTPPAKFGIPWANSAGAPYLRSIPQSSQIGIQNCAASLTDGFPPLTFVPSGSGGCPPFGQDFNGILKQLSQWGQWQAANGPVFYDSAFSTSANGYPKGAVLSSKIVPGYRWLSTAENNTTDPDAGGAGWVQDPGQTLTGTPLQQLTSTVPFGYVAANGLTVGNAASNATNRANADTQFLFAFIWTNCAPAACAIFTSTGSGSTRGANAAADYAANKAIATPNMNGAGLVGADSMAGSSSTNLNGVPIVTGTTTAPGSIVGGNLHTPAASDLPAVAPTVATAGTAHITSFLQTNFSLGAGGTGIWAATPGNNQPVTLDTLPTINPLGPGTPFSIVERNIVTYWDLKL